MAAQLRETAKARRLDVTGICDIPIFPLGTVLFPGSVLPLRIFEPRYVDMTKACIGDDSVFGVCLILDGREAGQPAVPHAVGCTARIIDWDVPAAGLFTLRTLGENLFRIRERRVQKDGLIRATVEVEQAPAPQPVDPEFSALVQLFERIAGQFGEQLFPLPHRRDDAAWICHRLADVLDLPQAARQHLLEAREPLAKQRLLWDLIRARAQPADED
jgi:uncharacterized protein